MATLGILKGFQGRVWSKMGIKMRKFQNWRKAKNKKEFSIYLFRYLGKKAYILLFQLAFGDTTVLKCLNTWWELPPYPHFPFRRAATLPSLPFRRAAYPALIIPQEEYESRHPTLTPFKRDMRAATLPSLPLRREMRASTLPSLTLKRDIRAATPPSLPLRREMRAATLPSLPLKRDMRAATPPSLPLRREMQWACLVEYSKFNFCTNCQHFSSFWILAKILHCSTRPWLERVISLLRLNSVNLVICSSSNKVQFSPTLFIT